MDFLNSMDGKENLIDGLLDGQGFVKVDTVSPTTHPVGYTPEYLIARAARVSYGNDLCGPKADKGLVEYLIRHQHTSPLEMCSITFCMRLPVAICRQLLRHRTGKFNEFSQRYSEVPEDVKRLRLDKWEEGIRGKCAHNKQASQFNLSEAQTTAIKKRLDKVEALQDQLYGEYKALLEDGLTREVSRFILPLSTYTTIYVQFDLNNLMKFFNLRCSPDAQYEIQVYANAMKKLAQQFFPISLNIHNQYQGGLRLGQWEKKMIMEKKIPEEIVSRTHIKDLRELAEELNIELTN